MSASRPGDVYFDPQPPTPPAAIFGFSTDLALDLCRSLQHLGPASRRLSADGHVLEGMVELFPLLERARDGEINAHDVRPYRGPIKKVVPGLHAVDEVMIGLTTLIPPVGGLGRIVLNTAVEKEFVKRVPEAFDRGAEYIPRIKPYVDLAARFDNPREQFLEEIGIVNAAVLSRTTSRGANPGPHDAAAGIGEAFEELLTGRQSTRALPLLAGTLAIRNRRVGDMKLPSRGRLAVVAPEILTMLSAPLPDNPNVRAVIESIRREPTAGRQMAGFLKHHELQALQAAAPVILPRIRDLLPTEGAVLRERFEDFRRFLGREALPA